MIKFFLFLKKIHFVLLFIILQFLALHYYANSTSYTKVKLVTASNYVVGGVHAQLAGLRNYFHLRTENTELNRLLAQTRNQLQEANLLLAGDNAVEPLTGLTSGGTAAGAPVISPGASGTSSGALGFSSGASALFAGGSAARVPFITDSLSRPLSSRNYQYYPARVINNSITRQENYITLDVGARDGIMPDMALVSGDGIVGYVLGCSNRFSVCMSVLNTNFRTSGRIKGNDYFGSVYWDGISFEYLTLSEIPKYAPVAVGDTIVTTNYSSIFPPDLMIGTVESFTLNNATYYDVKVKLHGNLAALNNLLVIRNLDAEEEILLEQSVGLQRITDGQ